MAPGAATIAVARAPNISPAVLEADIAAVKRQLLEQVRDVAATYNRADRAASTSHHIHEPTHADACDHLKENEPTGNADDDHTNPNGNMVDVQAIVTRACEYADKIVQTCFGAGANARNGAPHRDEEDDQALGGCVAAPASTAAVWAPASPVKCEEIRPAETLEIKPYDQAFQRLQDNLRGLDEERAALHKRVEAFVEDLAATRATLDKLEERVYHRLDRARARYILFVVKLEEEWLQDPDSIAVMKEPCADCATSRKARPPLKQPSPAKATKISTSAATKK